jgi:hypothetical protein
MGDDLPLSRPDLHILAAALRGPIADPALRGVCEHLQRRRLLERWRGPATAFILTRRGWRRLKSELARPPVSARSAPTA